MRSARSALVRKGRIYFIIRYGLLTALIAAVIVFTTGRKESQASFETVSKAIASFAVSDQMESANARYLKKIYGLNAEDYENVMIYIPTTNMSAQELVLIKLSSPGQSDAVVQALQDRIDSQFQIFEGYAPEQVALLNSAIVDPQGNYILYISGDNAEQIDQAFRSSL